MRIMLMAALVAGTMVAASAPADAAQGCGPGFHRGPYGRCHPNRGFGHGPGGRMMAGRFYPGQGYWDGHRYWHNRERYRDGWRYR